MDSGSSDAENDRCNRWWNDIDELRDPYDSQIGGSHYSEKDIQPTEYIMRNNLGWCEGNAVKYITRHETKGGADDIRKAIHYLQILLKEKYR